MAIHRGLRRRRAGSVAAARAGRDGAAGGPGPTVLCAAMCAALTAMTWRPEPAAATWMQVALFAMDGLQQFRAAGSTEGRGYVAVGDGDVLVVRWTSGRPPSLEKVPPPSGIPGC